MKKFIVFFAIFVMGIPAFAQKTHRIMGWKISKDIPLNELKVNLPFTIFGSSPEISYERILNTDISVGASLLASLDTDRNPYQFAFTPYFRWFFGGNRESMQKLAAGFFIEANGSMYSQLMDTGSVLNGAGADGQDSEMGAGLGLAIGWKYLTRNNWVGEIYLGGGRNFLKNDYGAEAYPRLGISIGKRF